MDRQEAARLLLAARANLDTVLAWVREDQVPTGGGPTLPPPSLPQPGTVTPPLTPRGPLAWGRRVSPTFRDRVWWIADTLGLDANNLMACMAFETGRSFSASVRNPASSATGLIQFMRSTALELGTTVEDLAKMTAEDQLNYVYKYFKPYAFKLKTLADTYMAILWPRGIGQPEDAPIFVSGTGAYAVNAGLDANKDHVVTKAEAAARVRSMLAEGLQPENAA